jgi:hypothetical protein
MGPKSKVMLFVGCIVPSSPILTSTMWKDTAAWIESCPSILKKAVPAYAPKGSAGSTAEVVTSRWTSWQFELAQDGTAKTMTTLTAKKKEKSFRITFLLKKDFIPESCTKTQLSRFVGIIFLPRFHLPRGSSHFNCLPSFIHHMKLKRYNIVLFSFIGARNFLHHSIMKN